MDRSFLSQPEVVAAAKKFVCIRLTSYEDETEKAFVATMLREVANTAFAILSPDGKPLTGRGRGPGTVFKDPADMAKGMDAIAEKYTKQAEGVPALPVALNAKVGLAVAAAENLPFVVVLAEDPKRRGELEATATAAAWSRPFEGRFIYATAASVKDLPAVQGRTITDGVLLIEPDVFGLGGKVVKQVAGDVLAQNLAGAMRETLRGFVPISKTRRSLAASGLKEGIFYETGIPVSGRGEAADRERYKQQLELRKKP